MSLIGDPPHDKQSGDLGSSAQPGDLGKLFGVLEAQDGNALISVYD